MNNEDSIMEVMELVAILTTGTHLAAKHGKEDEEFQKLVKCKTVARKNLESKLRELITEAYREGYMSGYAEAQEYL